MDLLVRSEPFYPLNYEGCALEINTKPRSSRGSRVSLLGGKPKQLIESWFIKPNRHFFSNEDDGYSHLS